MNRIVTAIDQEIAELDAKAAKLRMLRQAVVAIDEGEGDALIEGVPAQEIEPSAPSPESDTAPVAPTPEPGPEPEPDTGPSQPDHGELDERVYAAVAAAEGGWVAVGPVVAEQLAVSLHALGKAKERLLDAGRIERTGRHRGTRFRATAFPVLPDPPARPPKPEDPARERKHAANTVKARATRDRVAQMADSAGADGLSAAEVAVAVDITPASARGTLIRLVQEGRLLSLDAEGGGKRYRSKEIGLLPIGEDGCKTGVERRLLEAVQAAPVALTTVEVAANAKVSMVDAGRVLRGLAKRGVVRAIPLKTETSPQRWELPVEMAEAA